MIPAIGISRKTTMLNSKNPINPLLLEKKRQERIMIDAEDKQNTTQLKRTDTSNTFFNENASSYFIFPYIGILILTGNMQIFYFILSLLFLINSNIYILVYAICDMSLSYR